MEPIFIVSLVLLWVLVLLNLFLTLGLARRIDAGQLMPMPKTDFIKIGQPNPNFTAKTLKGDTVTRSTFDGQAVAFIFVSHDCKPCRDALPLLAALHPKAERLGVELVVVSDSGPAKTQALVDGLDTNLLVLTAPRESNDFLSDYKVSGTPCYYLIDTGGKVRATGMGVFDLDEKLRMLTGSRRQTTSPVAVR